jgi:hypothetical protein
VKGLDVDVSLGKMQFINGSRVVATTDGTLVCFLPTVQSFAPTLTFPDVAKDICYYWSGSVVSIGGSPNQQGQACSCLITALPEETASDTVLMAAPAGADFFMGRIKISRTGAPSHSWMGRSLGVLPVQSQWMSIPGAFSALVESEVNLARAMHVFIDSGNLILRMEQSIGPPPGGYGPFPTMTDGITHWHEGELVFNLATGTPVYLRDQKSIGYSPGGSFFTGPSRTFRRTGGSPCATNDVTNYSSTYAVNIEGRFGRRS